ncbi:MAG: aminotransferase, partial [Rhizobiaceae bacterium]|nr:aminotransferase [Rhizobiaceae bacterium]
AVPGYPPHPQMLAWLGEAGASRANAGYGAIEGDAPLREIYAAELCAIYGGSVSADNVHITAGCNEAFVTAVLCVAAPGESVLLTNPFYFNHETTLRMFGVRTELFACRAETGFVPDPAALDRALEGGARAVALVSPNNPTGAVYPPQVLAEIFAICRRRGVWLILDETYRDFIADVSRPPHALFEQPGWDENLISLYSFSKSYCIPGHRAGAVTAGRDVVEAIAKVMDNLQICAPRPPQAALVKAIPGLRDWREANRREIAARTDALRAVFDGLAGWELAAVGAYFGFVRHPFDGNPSMEVAEKLATKAGVLTIPGTFFGPEQEGFLRFAFANADVPTIGALRERLERFGSSFKARP